MTRKPRIDHDQLMKTLITALLSSFVEAFFPEVHPHLDWGDMRPAPTESYGLAKRFQPDLLFATRILGEPGQILFHIESQAQHQTGFARRMLLYIAVMSAAEGQRVLPIGISTYRRRKAEPTEVEMSFPFLEVLKFEHLQLHLKKQKWRQFAETDNPAVAALLSQMDYSAGEKVQVKTAFARAILRLDKASDSSELARDVVRLVRGYFDTYCVLDEHQELELVEALSEGSPEEAHEYMELLSKSERKGRVEGLIEGHIDAILNMVEGRFGGVPEGVRLGLAEIGDAVALAQVSRSIGRANTLQAVERSIAAVAAKTAARGRSGAKAVPST